MNRVSQILTQNVSYDVLNSFRALADRDDVSRIIFQHRARERRFKKKKTRNQHYLYFSKEKVLVKFLVQQNAFERFVRIKHVRSIIFSLVRQRISADRSSKPFERN